MKSLSILESIPPSQAKKAITLVSDFEIKLPSEIETSLKDKLRAGKKKKKSETHNKNKKRKKKKGKKKKKKSNDEEESDMNSFLHFFKIILSLRSSSPRPLHFNNFPG